MSPIGKIFVVVNLALSAAFLGWASNVVASGSQLKQDHDELRATYDREKGELEGEVAKLRTELNTVRADKQRASDERDDEKARADRAEGERDQLARENSQLRGDLTAIRASIDDYNDKLESISSAAKADSQARLAAERERNDAMTAKKDAELALKGAEQAARSAESRADGLAEQLAAAQGKVEKLDAHLQAFVARTGIPLSDITAQPDIEAAVVTVKSEPTPGLVSLNKGSNQGVRRGMTFEVFNAGTYKGQVKVEFVHDDWCSAVVMRPVPGQLMAQGDRAATNL